MEQPGQERSGRPSRPDILTPQQRRSTHPDPARRWIEAKTWLPRSPELAAEYDRLEREREARLAAADLEEQLENQRARELAEYGHALKARVEAAAGSLEGLSVPVNVSVDLTWSSSFDRMSVLPDLAAQLVEQAVMDTPAPDDLPGTPLSRLLGNAEHRGEE